MKGLRGYRVLCGALGGLFLLRGLVLTFSFFRAQAPGAVLKGPLPARPGGVHFMGFSGCALIGWGGGLLGAARRSASHRTLGTVSAVALVLMALIRITAWVMGDYSALGDVLRGEAVVFLLLALAFVWLRPPPPLDGTAGPL
jgi:hypothetical protein